MIDELTFRMEFQSSMVLHSDPENFLTRVEGRITCLAEDGSQVLAGKVRLFYADLGSAIDEGYNSYYILDLDAATQPFAELFELKNDEFSKKVERVVGDDILGRNLLILDRLEILPPYRGRRVGLACLFRCMGRYSPGAALVGLKCFPLQFEGYKDKHRKKETDEWKNQLALHEFRGNLRSCRSKLERYYRQLGFKRLPGTELMILNPCHRQPTFSDLGFED